MEKIVQIKDGLIIGKNGNQDLTGDLFLPPEGTENGAAIVFVHGGGWREGDKSQLRGYGILLARQGFVCLCTAYRLSDEALWPAQIQDVKCAIRYVRTHADDLKIDPNKIGVSGNSAGGHLSLMAGLSVYEPDFEGKAGNNEVNSKVKAICAIYPPAQIRKYDNSDPIIDAYKALMGKDAQQEDYDKASPLLQIKADFPPTMLIHGSTDSVVNLADSTDLYKKLAEKGVPSELHIYSEEEHAFDSQSGYGRSVAELQNLFFKKYL
tara:strand:+ start:242 stop:1036 length:795 start_codon:yes stop_codon:yes gene_type:complete